MRTLKDNEFKTIKIIIFFVGILLMLYGLYTNWISAVSFSFGLFLFYLSMMFWFHTREYTMFSDEKL